MDLHLCFDESDWQRIERDYMAWWAHALQRPLVQIYGIEPDPNVVYPAVPRFTSNFPLDMSADEVISRVALRLEAARYYGDAFPQWWLNFGPGIAAGFLGARVHSVDETVWFEPQQLREPHALHLSYDPENIWWRRVLDLTRTATQAWGDRVQVCHTDLGGNLDILASFRTTQNLLYDLYDAPEEIERLIGEITPLWIRYYDELDAIIRPTCRGTTPWAPIWARGTTYMLQCDFSYMISPPMFERFAMPDLAACCQHLDYAFYHLDGRGEISHLDQLLAIDRLRGIQWIPGDGAPPPEDWPALLRRIIDGGKLCQLFVSPEGALQIVRTVGGKGMMFTINRAMSADEAESFLHQLAREDLSRHAAA